MPEPSAVQRGNEAPAPSGLDAKRVAMPFASSISHTSGSNVCKFHFSRAACAPFGDRSKPLYTPGSPIGPRRLPSAVIPGQLRHRIRGSAPERHIAPRRRERKVRTEGRTLRGTQTVRDPKGLSRDFEPVGVKSLGEQLSVPTKKQVSPGILRARVDRKHLLDFARIEAPTYTAPGALRAGEEEKVAVIGKELRRVVGRIHPRLSEPYSGSGVPPVAEMRCRPLPSGAKTMTPSAFHVPPPGFGASAILLVIRRRHRHASTCHRQRSPANGRQGTKTVERRRWDCSAFPCPGWLPLRHVRSANRVIGSKAGRHQRRRAPRTLSVVRRELV